MSKALAETKTATAKVVIQMKMPPGAVEAHRYNMLKLSEKTGIDENLLSKWFRTGAPSGPLANELIHYLALAIPDSYPSEEKQRERWPLTNDGDKVIYYNDHQTDPQVILDWVGRARMLALTDSQEQVNG